MSPSDDLRVTVDHLIDLLYNTNPEEFNKDDIKYFIQFLEEKALEAVPHFSPVAVAKMIAAIPIVDPSSLYDRNGNPVRRAHRENAMAVAAALGPDHAQDLYRFTILVTKLA